MDKKEHKRKYDSKLRAGRIYMGLCIYCGRNKPEGGYQACSICRAKDTRYHTRKKLGLCTACGTEKPVEGKTRCESCMSKQLKHQHDKYIKMKEKGKCYLCGEPIAFERSTTMCLKHVTKSAEQVRLTSLHLRHERKAAVFKHYGGKCACCGFDALEALVIDHVNGGGIKELRAKGYHLNSYYKKIIDQNFPSSYQILCSNCNMAKGIGKKCTIDHNKHRKEGVL